MICEAFFIRDKYSHLAIFLRLMEPHYYRRISIAVGRILLNDVADQIRTADLSCRKRLFVLKHRHCHKKNKSEDIFCFVEAPPLFGLLFTSKAQISSLFLLMGDGLFLQMSYLAV